jgi:hypothetical protein
LNLTTYEDKQLILGAIVLSRLVKPTSIGYDSVWVKSFYHANGTTNHYHDQFINNLNVAFLIPGAENWNTITEADTVTMAELWVPFNSSSMKLTNPNTEELSEQSNLINLLRDKAALRKTNCRSPCSS